MIVKSIVVQFMSSCVSRTHIHSFPPMNRVEVEGQACGK